MVMEGRLCVDCPPLCCYCPVSSVLVSPVVCVAGSVEVAGWCMFEGRGMVVCAVRFIAVCGVHFGVCGDSACGVMSCRGVRSMEWRWVVGGCVVLVVCLFCSLPSSLCWCSG